MAIGGGRLLSRLAVSALATLLALVVANAWAARYQPVRQLLFRLDDELLHEPIPGARRMLVMPEIVGGQRVITELGPEGFRGPALGRLHGKRVVVIGDSLVLAENVAREETFVERLGVRLGEELGEPVEMINAGVSGYGPDQSLLRLQRDAKRMGADACVLVLCANNDYGDLIRNKIFRLDAGGSLVRGEYRLHERLHEMFAGWQDDARDPALLRFYASVRESRQRDLVLAQASGAAKRPPYIGEYLAAARAEFDDYASGSPLVYSLFRDYYDVDIVLYPAWPSARAKRRLMREVLRRFAEVCVAQELELFVLVVPSAVDLCTDFEIQVDRERYPSYSPAVLSASYVGLCGDLDLACHDLWEDYRAAGPDGLFVGHDDIHWNAQGQDLAARVVAPRIAALLTE